MRHLIFLFLLLTVSKSFAQFEDYSLQIAPNTYDSACLKQLCEPLSLPPYWRVNAKNVKSAYQILKEWKTFYKNNESVKLPTGFLAIRFFVSCKGELCCFRFYELDEKYHKTTYPQGLKDQLTAYMKQMSGWKLATTEDKTPTNYYYYLTFKIQDNDFKTVAP
jgi:hypothetical protein